MSFECNICPAEVGIENELPGEVEKATTTRKGTINSRNTLGIEHLVTRKRGREKQQLEARGLYRPKRKHPRGATQLETYAGSDKRWRKSQPEGGISIKG